MSRFEGAVMGDWRTQLAARIRLFGHRNWIVVADAAYPAQSRDGIETIVTEAEQLTVLEEVVHAVDAAPHIRARVYVDEELAFVSERDAPGVEHYRSELERILASNNGLRLPHEEIIARLDRAAQMFKILILKTTMTIPYTSVFFELDCGYWSDEAQERLRQAIPEVKE